MTTRLSSIKARSFIAFFALFTFFISCKCDHSNNPPPDRRQKNASKVWVLVHGLGSSAAALKNFTDKLNQALPDDTKVVALTRDRTFEDSIEEQAKKTLQKIKDEGLIGKIEGKTIKGVIGHSAGGLVVHKVAELLKKEEGKETKVITIGTPWEGASLANLSQQDLANKFLDHAYLNPIINVLASSGIDLKQKIKNNLPLLNGGQGVDDIKPGSTYLAKVARELPSNQIPILAIAGSGGNFLQFLTAYLGIQLPPGFSVNMGIVDQEFAKLIGGGREENHDTIVTVKSQRADSIKAKNFKRKTIAAGLNHAAETLGDNEGLIKEVTNFILKE